MTDVSTSATYHPGDTVSAKFVGANPRVSVSDSNPWERGLVLINQLTLMDLYSEQSSSGRNVPIRRSISFRTMENRPNRLTPIDNLQLDTREYCTS